MQNRDYLEKKLFEQIIYEPNTGCWLWTGYRIAKKYGSIFYKGKHHKTHRVSWEINFGPIPNDKIVCHKCDTPACVNPGHLYLGTHQTNGQDKAARKRAKNQNKNKTHCIYGHEFTVENTMISKKGGRVCRECDRIRGKSFYIKNKAKIDERHRKNYLLRKNAELTQKGVYETKR